MNMNRNISVITTSCILAITFCMAAAQQQTTDEQQASTRPGLVEIGPSKESSGRHVGVHVPFFFDMNLDTRNPGEGLLPNFRESIMGGMVRVNVNRKRGLNGTTSGPVKVTVFGIPMYDNQEPNPQ